MIWRSLSLNILRVLIETEQGLTKIGHFGEVLRRQSLGSVLKKTNPTKLSNVDGIALSDRGITSLVLVQEATKVSSTYDCMALCLCALTGSPCATLKR